MHEFFDVYQPSSYALQSPNRRRCFECSAVSDNENAAALRKCMGLDGLLIQCIRAELKIRRSTAHAVSADH